MKNFKNNSPIHPTPKGSGLSWNFFRKKIRGCRHLARLVKSDGPKLGFIDYDGGIILFIAYMNDEAVFLVNACSGSVPASDIKDKVGKFGDAIERFELSAEVECERFMNSFGTHTPTMVVMPDNIIESYDRFLHENANLCKRCISMISHHPYSPVPLYIYTIVGDSKNFFEWACRAYSCGVDRHTIANIIYWNEKYGYLAKNLERKTITAYVTHMDIVNLVDELCNLRNIKRAKDAINMFNTEQKHILRDGIGTHENDKKVLASFGNLSMEKKINFIKKMSTVQSYDEIINYMRLLTRDHFSWNKESFIRFVNGLDGIKFDIIADKGDILVGRVDDYETIKYVAKATNWCISKNKTYWNSYVARDSKRKQYVLLDFSKKEDDENSIIGFTVKDYDGIIMAHDYFNHDIMGCSEDCDEYYPFVSYLPKPIPYNNINTILESHGISISDIVTAKKDPFGWDRDSVMQYFTCSVKKFEVIKDGDDFLCIITHSNDAVNEIFGDKFMEAYGTDNAFKYILFFDFKRPQEDQTSIACAVILENAEDGDEVMSVIDKKVMTLGSTDLFNTILVANGLPYTTIRRPNTEDVGWASAIKEQYFYLIKPIMADNRKLKAALKNVDLNVLSFDITDRLFDYLSFDALEAIYSNGRTLRDFIGPTRLSQIIKQILRIMVERFGGGYGNLTREMTDKLLAHGITNPDEARYYSYFHAIRLILEHEDLSDMRWVGKLLADRVWETAHESSRKCFILEYVATKLAQAINPPDGASERFKKYINKIKEEENAEIFSFATSTHH